MISRGGKENILAAHYEWIVAGVGVLALIGAALFFTMTLGEDPESDAQAEAARIDHMKPEDTGVKKLDLAPYQTVSHAVRNPSLLAELSEKLGSFLSSERRVICSNEKCKKVISGDVKRFPKCPFCGTKQEEEKAIVIDADGDGMADDWEKAHGFAMSDASDADKDADKDGFTNLEEYKAKTNPRDKNSHPDYLDSITIQLPLKETYLPFVFTGATKVPTGYRCEFFNPKLKSKYNTGKITGKVGEDLGDTGFVIKSYEEKHEKREKKGMKGMLVSVDVSEVVLERKADGKCVTLVLSSAKDPKLTPIDVQATLVYTRGSVQTFDVVPGSDLVLNGQKYKVVSIKAEGKGAKVVIQDVASKQNRELSTLE